MSTQSTVEKPTVWRTKLRSTLHDNHTEQVEYCRKRNVIGIGWGHPDIPMGASGEQVSQFILGHDDPEWTKSGADTVRRFASEVSIGDFVWTRDTNSKFLLCKIVGPHRYRYDGPSIDADVHQQRRVEWAPKEVGELEVPGGVVRSFIGQSSSFCRIHDDATKILTPQIWADLTGERMTRPKFTRMQVLTELLDPYDTEDLIYMWMQVKLGYVALPRTQIKSTPVYEWVMIHKKTGQLAIVQVKTGKTRVELSSLAEARPTAGTKTYAFAASGLAEEDDPSLVDVVIKPEQLLAFVDRHESLLPDRIQKLFELAK